MSITAHAASKVFSIVLAGGEGKRLPPLTADRAKAAIPVGGNSRLIDFARSTQVNASASGAVGIPRLHNPRSRTASP
jgi:glucose-1-phosphate adenylyltransferase